jgi:hypothetical protein
MGRTLSFYKHKLFHYFHEFTNAPSEDRIVALTFPNLAKLRVNRTFLLSIDENPGIASAARSPCVFPYPENFIGRSVFGRSGFIGIRFAVSFSRADRAWE